MSCMEHVTIAFATYQEHVKLCNAVYCTFFPRYELTFKICAFVYGCYVIYCTEDTLYFLSFNLFNV